MKPNRWIETSRRCFTFLLNLYPREHRSDYAASMMQVFTDQCRDAYREKGILGIFFLWLRVLPDLGYTAVLEHLTSPRTSLGLMEPVPDAPLPWKGVFLVLLPGLVYLVSQIGQLTGETWYLTVYYRAAFFLILPVLVVWAITRRFPIWGLIPVGLLFRLVKEIGYQLITLHPGTFSSNPLLDAILSLARMVESNLFIPSALFIAISAFLAILYFRRNRPTRSVRIWGIAVLLVILARVIFDIVSIVEMLEFIPVAEQQSNVIASLQSNTAYVLYNASAFLLLIFLGTLFTRRHGFFTIFILVGYILPAIIVGTPWELENNPQLLFVITPAIMAYRSLLSLIAPIWMSRTRLQNGKKRVIIFCIALALPIHLIMQFYPAFISSTFTFGYSRWYFSVLLDELLLVFGFLMGMALYQTDFPLTDEIAPTSGAIPELIVQKPTHRRLELNQSITHFDMKRSKPTSD